MRKAQGDTPAMPMLPNISEDIRKRTYFRTMLVLVATSISIYLYCKTDHYLQHFRPAVYWSEKIKSAESRSKSLYVLIRSKAFNLEVLRATFSLRVKYASDVAMILGLDFNDAATREAKDLERQIERNAQELQDHANQLSSLEGAISFARTRLQEAAESK
jgi:hypothetical protein